MKDMVDIILKVRAGAYWFEASNPRHEHQWRVWEHVQLPEGKLLIPGAITQSTILVEHPKLVAERILRFAKLWGARTSSQEPIVDLPPLPVRWKSIRASSGRSSTPWSRVHGSRRRSSGAATDRGMAKRRRVDRNCRHPSFLDRNSRRRASFHL